MWIINGRFRPVLIPLRIIFHSVVVLLFEVLGALFMVVVVSAITLLSD